MKRVIAMLMACVFAASVCTVAFAMEGGWEGKGKQSMEKMHEKHLEKMTKDLNLTVEQKDKISALMKNKSDKMMAEKKKMMDAEKIIRDDYNVKLKEVLTPEQATKHNKMMEERKAKMEKMREKKKEKMMKKGMKEELAVPAVK